MSNDVTAAPAEGEPGRDTRISILIVAEVRLYREGLVEVLGRRARHRMAGAASDLAGALSAVSELAPDVAVIDTAVAGAREFVAESLALRPELKIIALTRDEDEASVLDWAEAGVAGYVTRESSIDKLLVAVESAYHGEMVCSPRLAATLLRRVASLASGRESRQAHAVLTGRELEIALLLDEGLSNKEIARRLVIEVATVKNHVHNILEKLQVRRRNDVVAALRTRGDPAGARRRLTQ